MHWFLALSVLFPLESAWGYDTSLALDDTWLHHQQCVGLKGSRRFDPLQEPSLSVRFDRTGTGIVSVVLFELGDEHLGGMRIPGTDQVGTHSPISAGLSRSQPSE
jgi:hypothetical protein